MKTNLIYWMILSLLCASVTSCKKTATNEIATNETSTEVSTEISKIDIPEIDLSKKENSNSKKKITDEERKILCVDSIKDLKDHPNSQIIRGAKIYESEKGWLEILNLEEKDHASFQYLVSYDKSGAFLDYVEVGLNMLYAGDSQFSIIKGNKIKYYSSWAEPLAEWGKGFGVIYTITNDLHFQTSRFPLESYPEELPFMMEGNDDGGSTYFWNIESVICTGSSDKEYQLTITGKGNIDCKNVSETGRQAKLLAICEDRKRLNLAIVSLPAVGKNETFEFTTGVPKGKFDEKTFLNFVIERYP